MSDMSIEIERRFLVKSDAWRSLVVRSLSIRQGYLANQDNATVRVRVVDDRIATLTIKSHASGTLRHEFEYQIPIDDARGLLRLRASGLLSKVRHLVPHDGLTWEVDVYDGENEGLVVAEVELTTTLQKIRLPKWVGQEISGDPRYSNSHLAEHPFWTFRTRDALPGLSLATE